MEELLRPEGMSDLQFAELRAAAETDERLDIWYSTVVMAQGLIEVATKAKELFEYGDQRVEVIAKDVFKIAMAHLTLPDVVTS
jgi:hypothetical protein